jgi:hypothetical protein
MAPKSWDLMPNELLLHIGSFLPHLRRHLLHDSWQRWKDDPKDKHSKAFNNIFKSGRWFSLIEELGLYAFLAGSDVVPYYHGKKGPHYLALCLAHNCNSSQKRGKPDVADIPFEEFLQTNRKVVTINHVGEYYFPDCDLTLNVRDATCNDYLTCVSEPHKLVGHKFGRLGFYSAYLNWNSDSFKYCEIGPENIIGIKDGPSVASIFGIELVHPENKFPGRQHYFHYPGVNKEMIAVWANDGTKLVGWRRESSN